MRRKEKQARVKRVKGKGAGEFNDGVLSSSLPFPLSSVYVGEGSGSCRGERR